MMETLTVLLVIFAAMGFVVSLITLVIYIVNFTKRKK